MSFHDDLVSKETPISLEESSKIVRGISRKWGLKIEQLYPQKKSNMNYSWGASLGPRHGVIWVDNGMCYPSYVLHEIAHVVVECFMKYDLGERSAIREEGHGVLFFSVLYHWLNEYYKDNKEMLKNIEFFKNNRMIFMADSKSYSHMKKLFKKQTLL